jgi:hypothetical protein
MNSPLPDDDAMYIPEVLLVLKDLVTCVVILERRIATSLATSWLPPSHFTKIPKELNFPPLSGDTCGSTDVSEYPHKCLE